MYASTSGLYVWARVFRLRLYADNCSFWFSLDFHLRLCVMFICLYFIFSSVWHFHVNWNFIADCQLSHCLTARPSVRLSARLSARLSVCLSLFYRRLAVFKSVCSLGLFMGVVWRSESCAFPRSAPSYMGNSCAFILALSMWIYFAIRL